MQDKKAASPVFAVLLLVCYIFYSQGVLVNHVRQLFPKRLRELGVCYEQRLSPLQTWLPDVGIVGYASDTGNEHFLRAQYVLAPVILDRGGKHRLIVANFSRDRTRPKRIDGRPYHIIKNLHNGVALLSPEPSWPISTCILLLSPR